MNTSTSDTRGAAQHHRLYLFIYYIAAGIIVFTYLFIFLHCSRKS